MEGNTAINIIKRMFKGCPTKIQEEALKEAYATLGENQNIVQSVDRQCNGKIKDLEKFH